MYHQKENRPNDSAFKIHQVIAAKLSNIKAYIYFSLKALKVPKYTAERLGLENYMFCIVCAYFYIVLNLDVWNNRAKGLLLTSPKPPPLDFYMYIIFM